MREDGVKKKNARKRLSCCILLLHHLWIAAAQREVSLVVDTAAPGTLLFLRGKTPWKTCFIRLSPLRIPLLSPFVFVVTTSIDGWAKRTDHRTRKKDLLCYFLFLFFALLVLFYKDATISEFKDEPQKHFALFVRLQRKLHDSIQKDIVTLSVS